MSIMQILLIQHNIGVRAAVRQQIEQDQPHCNCEISDSLLAANAKVALHDFDAVVLDADAVDETISTFLTLLASRYIPVLVLAKLGQEETVLALMQQGVTDYLLQDDDRNYLKLLPTKLQRAISAVRGKQQIERSLHQSEERFRVTFEQAAVGICHASTDGRLLRFNRRFCEIVGYSPEELQLLTFQEITYPDDLPANLKQLHQLLRGYLSTYTLEKRYIRKDRTVIWLNLTVSLAQDTSRDQPYLIGVVEDINERKQAEGMLRNLVEGAAAVTGQNFFPALARYVAAALDVRYVMITRQQGDRFTTYVFWANGQMQPNLTGPLDHRSPCSLAMAEELYCCPSQLQQQFPDNHLLADLGAESYLGIRLTNVEGDSIGTLCILDCKPLDNYQRATAILQVFAARVSAELQRQEAIDALHQLNQELELRVEERTAELKQTNYQLQQAMAERETLSVRLALAVTSGGIGIWEWDILQNQVFWDDRMYELYGLQRSDFSNAYEAWLHAIHPDDQAEAEAISLQARRGEREYNPEFRVIHGDGSIHYLQAYALIQRNEAGEPLRMIGINFDITDRKQAEARLRASEAALLEAQRVAHIGNWEFDVVSQTIHWSEELYRMFGLELSHPIPTYQEYVQKLHPDDRANLIHCVERAITTGQPYRIDYRVILADGTTRYHEGRGEVICNHQGQVVKLFGTALDISDRKQIALQLQQQLEKEQLLVSILKRIRDSLDLNAILNVAVKEMRQTIQADRALVYRFQPDGAGRVVAEAIVEPWHSLLNQFFSADTLPHDCFERYIRGGIYQIEDSERAEMAECARRFMSKLQIRAKLVVPIVQQENQQVWGLLIAHECSRPRSWETWEITLLQQLAGQLAIAIQQANLYQQLHAELEERQCAEANLQTINEQLQIANMELARATRLKDEFLANMSHELRTPLNAILGMSEALQEMVFGELNLQQQKAVATVEQSGRHLLDLINDILDLAKIEAGKLELSLARHSVRHLCHSSLSLVKQMAHGKKIQLHSKMTPPLSDIDVDDRRLRQVLINLLSNAIKFTPEGGCVTLETWNQVRESVSGPQHFVCFAVSDTGIGIAPEDLSKLFQSFVQIDSKLNRQYTGTGLGLVLVKRIVELHGGWVDVESTLNQGSKFTVVLPYQPEPGMHYSPILQAEGLKHLLQPASSGEGKVTEVQPLVLLAEDNQANVETYSNYLVSYGYRLITASNGSEAVFLATSHQPDLILMDIQMPAMDGLEAIRQIRALPELVRTPIIALTALAMPGDREKCMEVGANEYLTKPIRLRYLVNKISELLHL